MHIGYRKVKGVRIYLIGPQKRIIHVASWHQVQEADEFTEDLMRIAERIDVDRLAEEGVQKVPLIFTPAKAGVQKVLEKPGFPLKACGNDDLRLS